ncbi:hypothetical protein [Nocardioides bruguierae]|uniref:Lipoprotein n=1 Tax=Nocardioides bruguierae TaxID=2945102 RepID=A0A9X2IFF3_9ACTN|nr:hypothetical protein [Nocardioides bruguierae]MCM0621262.1 hypothetical protein [Nocardioides bruguierae]
MSRPTTSRMGGRALGSVLGATVLAALGAGCNGDVSTTEQQGLGTQVQAVADQVASGLPGGTVVEAVYEDGATSPAVVRVRLACDGCERRAAADDLARALWESTVTPVRSLVVSVEEADGGRRVEHVWSTVTPEDRADLVERYGERDTPIGTTPAPS